MWLNRLGTTPVRDATLFIAPLSFCRDVIRFKDSGAVAATGDLLTWLPVWKISPGFSVIATKTAAFVWRAVIYHYELDHRGVVVAHD